jgi:Glycosyl hydrolases family 17
MGSIRHQLTLFWLIILYLLVLHTHKKGVLFVEGIGCNWGTRASHPLPPDITVRMLRDNGFNKVKLFEAEPWVMEALGRSGIEVMVGIPNDFLASLSANVEAAERWVMQNVSSYISKHGVDIRYAGVVVHISQFHYLVAT